MNSVMQQLAEEYKDKKILIVGLGLQGGGLGMARFFAKLGADVTVTDLRSPEVLQPSIDALKEFRITYVLGKHQEEDFKNAQMIMIVPSMKWSNPYLQVALKNNVPIHMEMEFFCLYAPSQIIGVTGTRGKSTTSTAVYTMLKAAGESVFLAGNVSGSSTISLLETLTKDDIVVLELSSWALSAFHRSKISPPISVFTNIYPDHLNYYNTPEDYLHDKKAIYLYQKKGDSLVAGTALKEVITKDAPESEVFFVNGSELQEDHYLLKGKHNMDNLSLVYKIGEILSIPSTVVDEALSNFSGLPFRQEIVGEEDSVMFVNDTTSTTPIATVTALKRFTERPVVLILGGNAKGLPTNELVEEVGKTVYVVLLKGTMTDEIEETLQKKYPGKFSPVFDDLEKATQHAYEYAQSLEEPACVLFSPAATSFAMFNNEFHRGEFFNTTVKKIIHG